MKKRVVVSQWFRSVDGALNTIAGYEAMNIIRKGQIRWLPKTDTVENPVYPAHLRHRCLIRTAGPVLSHIDVRRICDTASFKLYVGLVYAVGFVRSPSDAATALVDLWRIRLDRPPNAAGIISRLRSAASRPRVRAPEDNAHTNVRPTRSRQRVLTAFKPDWLA